MLKSLAIALLLASSSLQAMDSKGALACLEALPEKYRNGVLKLSADNADPDPDTWYVSAQAGPDDKGMRSIEVASGQIISDKPALGLREIFSSAKSLDLSKVQLDSREIFDIAQQFAGANGKQIGTVSFVLNQQGSSAVPIWSVWCYGPNGTYFGELQFLATDGTVISNDAFPKKP
jgi:hypothetical protein